MKNSVLAITLLVTNFTVSATETLPKITVTTNNRYIQDIDEVINSTTVITRQEIENLQATTVAELISNVAGINVSATGGRGTVTSVFVHGLKAGKEVSVLIDGVASDQSGTGDFSWETIDPEIIERIEIVRGARAMALGNGAVATINIITRKGARSSIKYTFGSYGTKKIAVSTGGKSKNAGINVTYINETNTGYSATNKDSVSFNKDKDGFKLKNTSIKTYYKPSGNNIFTFNILNIQSKADFDSGATEPTYSNGTKSLFSLGFQQQVNDIWDFSIKTAKSSYDYDSISTYNYSRKILGEQNSFINNFSFDAGVLTIGNDFVKNDTTFYTYQSGPNILSSTANFASWKSKISDFSYELGARKAKHNRFGNLDTNSLGIAYQITKNFKAKATTGKFTNAPSSYQLNGDGGSLVNPNQDLKPQTTKTTDLGLVYRDKSIVAEISFYRTKITDPITYNGTYGTPPKQYINGAKTEFTGTDISYQQKISNRLTIKSNLTILDYIIKTTDKVALKRPNKLTLGINKKIGSQILVGVNVLAVGKAAQYGDKESKAYQLINITSKYKFTKQLSLHLKIENLSDTEYQTTYGYNTPGRSAYLTLEYKTK